MHGRNPIVLLVLTLTACAEQPADTHSVSFEDVTEQVGLRSQPTMKYGGPTLADLDNDGRYDLVLGNHADVAAQLFFATDDRRFVESGPIMRGDVHGIAAGDYDRDGLVDLAVSLGGGNGTTPQPPRLLRNTGGGFEDMTEAAGIADLGARGRSVRWIDIDADGDLDLLQIVAAQLPGEARPRNILFENLSNGQFRYRESPAFEDIEAERVLVTDIDNDNVPDLVTFTPLRVMQGDKQFGFRDVSAQWLSDLSSQQRDFAMAVSATDIDNDGDLDLYVARGKTYYEIANNSLELDQTGRMNLRDEGNAGQDFVEFDAGDELSLSDFYHWPRGVNLTLPVYLGAAREAIDTPTTAVEVSADQALGFPPQMDDNGWYLGHLGNGRWKLAWNLNGDLAWDLRASVSGVNTLYPAWKPQERAVPDLLLINEGDRFLDASDRLPHESGDNNWGVIAGDFDNDADSDFFVWRFGYLHGRVADVLLSNHGDRFVASTEHGATKLDGGGHGDMGAPLDYDGDGWLDILSGSDDHGTWNLFRNTGGSNKSVTVRIGSSPLGVDAHGASVTLTGATTGTRQFRQVASAGAVHSQGLNTLVHFGLGANDGSANVHIRWRDGSELVLDAVSADGTYEVGHFASQQNGQFDPARDLLLLQFDATADVGDLHAIAAAATLLRDPRFDAVTYHAVVGIHDQRSGTQLLTTDLLQRAFGDNWSDAHSDRTETLAQVAELAAATLSLRGRVWVAQAGLSDFTADWMQRLNNHTLTDVHVVAYGDENERRTDADKLAWVKAHATYHPIETTLELRLASPRLWDSARADERSGSIWSLTQDLAERHNGSDGRSLNTVIEAGGMDFSAIAPGCWILGCAHLSTVDAFLRAFLPADSGP